MFFYLLLLFTLVPLVELWLLLRIAEHTSLLFTIGLVLLTGVIGAALARWQGWLAVYRIQQEMRSGRMPTDSLFEGLLILVAAAVLVTPGVLTDAVGFTLLVPPARRLIMRGLKYWFRNRFRFETVQVGPDGKQPPGDDSIIDVQVVDTHTEDAE